VGGVVPFITPETAPRLGRVRPVGDGDSHAGMIWLFDPDFANQASDFSPPAYPVTSGVAGVAGFPN
jgi:hypothetical protein